MSETVDLRRSNLRLANQAAAQRTFAVDRRKAAAADGEADCGAAKVAVNRRRSARR
jgi:hypothetical protein